jgi:tetratricopeptide (TPR) repeat protein
LPVDAEIHGVQPHAHYLAREVNGFATLPNGDRRWLIRIDDWDFDWQDFYSYADPIILPKGTELTMEITYDNSVGNRRNPYSPPKRVTWGQGSLNEMGDLWIQVLPQRPADLAVLNADRRPQELAEDLVGFEMVLKTDPDQPVVHDDAALLYLQFGQVAQAVAHFRESARLRPDSAAAKYNLGTTLLQFGAADEAVGHLEEALKIDPGYIQAHNNLGAALRSLGRFRDAIVRFRQALIAQPEDREAQYNLANALLQVGEIDEAITHYQALVVQQPGCW